jgi:hypothetical protein
VSALTVEGVAVSATTRTTIGDSAVGVRRRAKSGVMRSHKLGDVRVGQIHTDFMSGDEATILRAILASPGPVLHGGTLLGADAYFHVSGVQQQPLGADLWVLSWRIEETGFTPSPLLFSFDALAPGAYTFTRSGPAPYTDSDGVPQSAPTGVARVGAFADYTDRIVLTGDSTTNIILQSDNFNATWTGVSGGGGFVVVTTSGVVGPDGAFMQNLEDNSAAAVASVAQALTIPANSDSYACSLRVDKTDHSSNVVQFAIVLTGGGQATKIVLLDLSDGSLTAGAGSAEPDDYDVIDEGSWWRIWLTVTNNGSSTGMTVTIAPSSESVGLVGNATIGDVQVEVGTSPTDYVPTTTAPVTVLHTAVSGRVPVAALSPAKQNLMTNSEDFDAATGGVSGLVVTADQFLAPDGETTADKVDDQSAVTVEGTFVGSLAHAGSTTWVHSIHVHKTALTDASYWIRIRLGLSGGTSDTGLIYFRPSDQTIIEDASDPPAGSGVVDEGTYWRVYIAMANPGGNTSFSAGFRPVQGDHATDPEANPDATLTGFAVPWGWQIEEGSTPGAYTATGAVAINQGAEKMTKPPGFTMADIRAAGGATFYTSWIERGTAYDDTSSTRYWQVGDDVRLLLFSGSSGDGTIDGSLFEAGGINANSAPSAVVPLDKPAEARLVVYLDPADDLWKVQLGVSVDGAAEVLGSVATFGATLPDFDEDLLTFAGGHDSNVQAPVGLRTITGARGVYTMDQMRKLAAARLHAKAAAPIEPPSLNLWISKAEIDTRPMSGDDWTDMLATADATWPAAEMDDQDSTANLYALSGALVYLRTGTTSYRTKVESYLQDLINAGYPKANGQALGYARNLGAYVLAADMCNIRSSNPSLHTDFAAFAEGALTESYVGGGMNNVRDGAYARPNNIGNACRWTCIITYAYVGNTPELDGIVEEVAFWLGDRTRGGAEALWGPTSSPDLSWHEDPTDSATYRGIVSAGVTRFGHDWSGIQPEEMRRDDPFWSGTFPADGTSTSANLGTNAPTTSIVGERLYFTDDGVNRVIDTHNVGTGDVTWVTPKGTVPDSGEQWTVYPGNTTLRYVEEALDSAIGTVEIIRRLGYGNAHLWSNSAVLRAVTRLKYFADNHADNDWTYFTEAHEASRPLINYLYSIGYPEARVRTQLGGGTKTFAYTHYTHSGRSV